MTPVPTGCELKDESVVLDGVRPELLELLGILGSLHIILFPHRLVITSGRDSQHVTHSLHYEGRAVDVRTHDLDPEDLLLLIHIVAHAALSKPIGYFYEVRPDSSAHLHLEYTWT